MWNVKRVIAALVLILMVSGLLAAAGWFDPLPAPAQPAAQGKKK